jgi:hypothetical protein
VGDLGPRVRWSSPELEFIDYDRSLNAQSENAQQ